MARTPRIVDTSAPLTVGPVVVGKVVMAPLASVRPNQWNPNEMTVFEMKSLALGLKTDGWLASMSLLVWGTDEKGVRRNIIIDGEHRWTAAPEAGFVDAPMVFLDGLTETKAKALTIKLFQRRGTPNQGKLGELLRELQYELEVPDIGMELGVDTEALMGYLAEAPDPMHDGGMAPPEKKRGAKHLSEVTTPPGTGEQQHIRMVQLFFKVADHEEFLALKEKLGPKFGKEPAADVVLEAMRRAANTA